MWSWFLRSGICGICTLAGLDFQQAPAPLSPTSSQLLVCLFQHWSSCYLESIECLYTLRYLHSPQPWTHRGSQIALTGSLSVHSILILHSANPNLFSCQEYSPLCPQHSVLCLDFSSPYPSQEIVSVQRASVITGWSHEFPFSLELKSCAAFCIPSGNSWLIYFLQFFTRFQLEGWRQVFPHQKPEILNLLLSLVIASTYWICTLCRFFFYLFYMHYLFKYLCSAMK